MIVRNYATKLSTACLLMLLQCSVAKAQDDANVVKEFQQRVNAYVSLQHKQGLPTKQTDSPGQLAEQKQEAVEKIQDARPVAKQGDIFSPQIASYFKKQIRATLKGAEGNKVRASLRHAEPLPTVHLEVNGRYPRNLPLQSTPPTLLQNLPQLPKELQYRFVGSTLVLYDESSNLIVDLLPGALG